MRKILLALLLLASAGLTACQQQGVPPAPSAPSFTRYQPIYLDVARAYRNEKEEEVMQAFLARLRKRFPVEKHEELLKPLASQAPNG